ncbi:hypothetical protein [uncultured Porphyromonas sp.]|nr:hypothetical protein [uncultured Porphyromonas sp.]
MSTIPRGLREITSLQIIAASPALCATPLHTPAEPSQSLYVVTSH